MRVRRMIVVVLVGLVLTALSVPLVLTSRATGLAMKTVRQVFEQTQGGDFRSVETQGLITEDAVQSLRTIGNKTGSFRLRRVVVRTCQASGAPCILSVDLEQKQHVYPFRLYVYWGTITFAVPMASND